MSSILVTCGNKAHAEKHYIPAVRLGGWEGGIALVSPEGGAPSLEGFAGLLMVGGADIHPCYWGDTEPVHPAAKVDDARDALEIPVARAAWALGLPILGICRGEQILNVALGGSLIQDVPSHFGCELAVHSADDTRAGEVCHTIVIEEASRLAALMGVVQIGVNSSHHQAVGRIAPGLKATAWSATPDGVAEGVEAADGDRWVFGTQWHPERLVSRQDETGLVARRIFEGFAQAAKLRKV